MEECSVFIHDTYIADGDWRESLWIGIMTIAPGFDSSDTLVDVVNQIWNVASTAITIIKERATEFVEGVKAGFEYLQEEVLTTILDSLIMGILGLIRGFFISASSTSSIYDYTELTDGLTLYDEKTDKTIVLSISRSDLDITLIINDFSYTFSFFDTINECTETLAGGDLDLDELAIEKSIYATNWLSGGILSLLLSIISLGGAIKTASSIYLAAGLALGSAIFSLLSIVGIIFGTMEQFRVRDDPDINITDYDHIIRSYHTGMVFILLLIIEMMHIPHLLHELAHNPVDAITASTNIMPN